MFSLRFLKIWIGGAILSLLVVCGVAAPFLAPRDPQAQTLEDRLRPPRWLENGSPAYSLGTDNLGRDMLSRIIYGSRISLMVGLATVLFAGLVGCTLGAVAGYFGSTADEVVSKISEIFLAFPFLLIAIAIMAFLGQGVGNLIMALMLSRWVQYCRVVRGEVLSLKERDFVSAAKALGGRDFYVLFHHVVPNTFASVTVIATFGMAIVIITEASLSFLGLGVQPPAPTWGAVISDGRSFLQNAPWISGLSGAAIMITVLGLNLLGDGLRDVLDPTLRGEGEEAVR